MERDLSPPPDGIVQARIRSYVETEFGSDPNFLAVAGAHLGADFPANGRSPEVHVPL
jgi:hypothetical protein